MTKEGMIELLWIGLGILTSVQIIMHSIEVVQRWICEERKENAEID